MTTASDEHAPFAARILLMGVGHPEERLREIGRVLAVAARYGRQSKEEMLDSPPLDVHVFMGGLRDVLERERESIAEE